MTITAMEQLISAAERRALVNNESETVARITDVFHIVPALTGKLELVYEGEQEGASNVAKHIIGKGIKKTFARYFPDPGEQKKSDENIYQPVLDWFADGNTLDIKDTLSRNEYKKLLKGVDGLSSLVEENSLLDKDNDQYVLMDFVIEALHQHSMVGKEELDDARSYSDMLGSMLGSIDDLDDFDDFEQ